MPEQDFYWAPRKKFEYAKSELFCDGYSCDAVAVHLHLGVVANITLLTRFLGRTSNPGIGGLVYTSGEFVFPDDQLGWQENLSGISGTYVTDGGCTRNIEEWRAIKIPVPFPRASNTPYGYFTPFLNRVRSNFGLGCGSPGDQMTADYTTGYNTMVYAAHMHQLLTTQFGPLEPLRLGLISGDQLYETFDLVGIRINSVIIPNYLTKDASVPLAYHLGWVTFGRRDWG